MTQPVSNQTSGDPAEPPPVAAAALGIEPDTGLKGLAGMTLGAMGIVFGDIGTSPLYALRSTFYGRHRLPVDPVHIYGIVSLMFWSMMVIVTLKYVFVLMRADNRGSGGSLSLLALINREISGRRWSGWVVLLGVMATALFYGDSMLTPAVSVLGAVEGLAIYHPGLSPAVMPLAVGILVFLFLIQKQGTARVVPFFGPIMYVYFTTITVLGLISIWQHPQVVTALSPIHAIDMFVKTPWRGFLAMGSAVLAVTGAEALYADMGYFGRRPIRVSWLVFVLPALVINYLGQAALLLRDPHAVQSPFFLLAPPGFEWPLLLIACAAALIACQAVITGAYLVTQQAIQLGFIPRLSIRHTSSHAGQIYIPAINWILMVAVLILVLVFERSNNLVAAYGIAVTGAMAIDNVLLAVVLFNLWKWRPWLSVPLLTLFFVADAAYLGANFTKIPDGGWIPLAMGILIFTMLTTWSKGRALMRANMAEDSLPFEIFAKSAHGSATRVPGTAVFMSSAAGGVPSALLHNIKHNRVLHERVVVLTVSIEDVPSVPEDERVVVKAYGDTFYKLKLRFGFLEETDVPAALARATVCGAPFDMMHTSFFLSRQTLIAAQKPGMALWRERLFGWMLRNAASAMEFFRLPTNRVVELGSQVEI